MGDKHNEDTRLNYMVKDVTNIPGLLGKGNYKEAMEIIVFKNGGNMDKADDFKYKAENGNRLSVFNIGIRTDQPNLYKHAMWNQMGSGRRIKALMDAPTVYDSENAWRKCRDQEDTRDLVDMFLDPATIQVINEEDKDLMVDFVTKIWRNDRVTGKLQEPQNDEVSIPVVVGGRTIHHETPSRYRHWIDFWMAVDVGSTRHIGYVFEHSKNENLWEEVIETMDIAKELLHYQTIDEVIVEEAGIKKK